MPSLLAVGLVGVALAALCSAVPPMVAVGLAAASGVLLEIVYHAEAAESAVLDSAARVLLLAAVAFGVVALRRPARPLMVRRNPPGGR
jgi:hypothetical protein